MRLLGRLCVAWYLLVKQGLDGALRRMICMKRMYPAFAGITKRSENDKGSGAAQKKRELAQTLKLEHRKTRGRIVAVIAWALLFAVVACATTRATGPFFTIRVRHVSNVEDFEDHRVRPGEEFFIADTEYSAKVERFVPDFAINLKTKEVVSRSEKLLNPAVQLAFSYQGQLQYETWALYQSMIPHTIRDPGYYFQFISYENTGYSSPGPKGR
ncbi:MAG: hypothetical protein HY801_09105 [Candidatus Lindowbacteria bacterium]|nr:hypothetical protein [Candidatus Lindowbacteria bacterium]